MEDVDNYEISAEEAELYEMSDEELEAAMKEAKSELADPDIDNVDPEVTDNSEDGNEPDSSEELDNDNDSEEDKDSGTEQPDEDSDNAADDDNEDDEGKDDSNDKDLKDDDPVEPADEQTPEPEVPELDSEDTTQDKTYKIRANGMDYEFTVEELQRMAPQAIDYTKKAQAIAPWRRSISALEEAKLTEQDVNMMIDVFKGNKEAIAEILKRHEIDPIADLGVDDDTPRQPYVPNVYGKDERQIALDDVISSISTDKEYAITQHVVDTQWDSKSREILAQNPAMIAELHSEIRNGVYDKIAPTAMKYKVLDGAKLSDVEYYIQAEREYFAQQAEQQKQQQEQINNQQKEQEALLTQQKQQVDEAKKQKTKQRQVKEKANSRKAAAPTKNKAGTKSVVDYLDDSDEAYEQWYKELQAKM